MAGKGNRMKEPVVQADVEEEKEQVAEEKPVKKIKQRKEKPAPSGPSKIMTMAKDERTHKITGLFLLLMSVFMLNEGFAN